MDTTDKLIIAAKKLALQQMITKIQDEIEKLEDEEKKADEIPFQGLTHMGQYHTIPYNRKRNYERH